MIEIKRLFVEDAEKLAEVAVRAYSDHYLDFWYDGGRWYIEKSFNPATLREELADETNRFYFAVFENEPVGFLKTRTDRTTPELDNRKALEIERIYLMKKAQGKRIGKALIDFSIEQARAQKMDLVWLKAMDTSDAAIAFYKKSGFETCGHDYLDLPPLKKELRGMVVMKKDIENE